LKLALDPQNCLPKKRRTARTAELDERFKSALERIEKDESRRYSGVQRPWEDADGNIMWSRNRIRVATIMRAQKFEMFMGAIIIGNVALIISEVDLSAKCHPEYDCDDCDCPYDPSKESWMVATNWALLIAYSIEATCRLYAERWEYFTSRWNCLDLFVVFSGWISEAGQSFLPSVAFLRIFRIARLSRAFRIVLSVRELYMLITGLGSSARAIFFGMLLLFFMLALWAILLVEFVHPINAAIPYGDDCERCPRGFGSVWASMLTLFQQIVAGDSWGTISVQVIEKRPWTAVLFASVVVTISLGVMNLILAVIVESAAEAREADVAHRIEQKKHSQDEQKKELTQICVEMDQDKSGTISLDEMLNAWDVSSRFKRVMTMLEVRREEIANIFHMLEKNSDGEVDYTAFVNQIYQIRSNDVRTTVALIRHSLHELHHELRGGTRRLEIDDIDHMVRDQTTVLSQHSDMLGQIAAKMGISHKDFAAWAPCAVPAAQVPRHAKSSLRQASKPRVAGVDEMRASGADEVRNAKERPSPARSRKRPARLKANTEHVELWDESDSSSCSSSATAVPCEAGEVAKSLRGVQKQLDVLVQRNDDVVRRASEQNAVLLKHSDYLASLRGLLPKEESHNGESLATASRHLDRLRRHLRESHAEDVRAFELRLEQQNESLSATAGILEDLATSLGYSAEVHGHAARTWLRTGERPGKREVDISQDPGAEHLEV